MTNLQRLTIVNLTPHNLNIVKQNGEKITIESSGVARVKEERIKIGELNGIALYKTSYSDVEGLPPKSADIYYVVSMLTAQAVPDRDDILTPGNLIRDEHGIIIGCEGLNSNI